jgi:Ran GTPase-activating protein (RanGAP) involved in mRNA processing and transport
MSTITAEKFQELTDPALSPLPSPSNNAAGAGTGAGTGAGVGASSPSSPSSPVATADHKNSSKSRHAKGQAYTPTTTKFADLMYDAICADADEQPTTRGGQAFRDFVFENCTDRCVALPDARIGPTACITLMKLLRSSHTPMRRLDLSNNYIGDYGVIAVVQAIKTIPTLKHVRLQGNGIGHDGVLELAQLLVSNQTLVSLDLSSASGATGISGSVHGSSSSASAAVSVSASAAAAATSSTVAAAAVSASATGIAGSNLSADTKRAIASMKRNFIGPAEATQLAVALGTNRSLTSLSLRGNVIGCANTTNDHSNGIGTGTTGVSIDAQHSLNALAEALSVMLARNRSLNHLDLEDNQLGSKISTIVLQALLRNQTLRHLNLARNNIGAECGDILRSVLAHNTSLITLKLNNNNLSASGVCSFLPSLMGMTTQGPGNGLGSIRGGNTSLVTLDLSNNGIGDQGADAVAQVIRTNYTLTTINLCNNNITEIGGQAIAAALCQNSVIVSVGLSSNGVKNGTAIGIAEALVTNESISTLELCSCKISDDGAIALASAIAHNPNTVMRKIRLRDNYISGQAGDVFTEALQRNRTITIADVRGNQIDHVRLNKLRSICRRNLVDLKQAEPRRLRHEISRLKGEQLKLIKAEKTLKSYRQSIQETESKLHNIEMEKAQFLAAQTKRRAELQARIDQEQEKIDGTRAKLEDKKSELDNVKNVYQKRLDELHSTLEQETNERKRVEDRLQKIKHDIQNSVSDRPARVEQLKKQIETVRAEKLTFQKHLTNIRKELTRLQKAYKDGHPILDLIDQARDMLIHSTTEQQNAS